MHYDEARLYSITKRIIGRVAPRELSIVDLVGPSYLASLQGLRNRFTRNENRDAPLGVGGGEVSTIVTPVVILMVYKSIEMLAEDTYRAGKSSLTGLIRRRRKHHRTQEGQPPTPEQLAAIRQQTERIAKEQGISTDMARAIANQLIGCLLEDATSDD